MYVISNHFGLVDVCENKRNLYLTTFELSLAKRGAVYVTPKSTVRGLADDLKGMGYTITKRSKRGGERL